MVNNLLGEKNNYTYPTDIILQKIIHVSFNFIKNPFTIVDILLRWRERLFRENIKENSLIDQSIG